MATTYNKLLLDISEKPNHIITAVQNDTNSRYLDVFLYDKGVPIDLTGHEVRIVVRRKGFATQFDDGEITDATAGRCQFLLSTSILKRVGKSEVQISIWKDNTEILSSQIFDIMVTKSLLEEGSIETSNEYGTLVVLFQNIYEAYELMTRMVENIGVPAEVAAQYDLATMWQAWEFLVAYMKGDLTDKIDEAIANASVQGVLNVLDTITAKEESSQKILDEMKIFSGEQRVVENVVPFPASPFKPVGCLPVDYSYIDSNDTHIFLFQNWFGTNLLDGAYNAGLLISIYDKETFTLEKSVVLNNMYIYGVSLFVNNAGLFIFNQQTNKIDKYDLNTFEKTGESAVIYPYDTYTASAMSNAIKDIHRDNIVYLGFQYYVSSNSSWRYGYFDTNNMTFTSLGYAIPPIVCKDYFYFLTGTTLAKYDKSTMKNVLTYKYVESAVNYCGLFDEDILLTQSNVRRISTQEIIGQCEYDKIGGGMSGDCQVHKFVTCYGAFGEVVDEKLERLYLPYNAIKYKDKDYIYCTGFTDNADNDKPYLIVCKYEPTYKFYGYKEVPSE